MNNGAENGAPRCQSCCSSIKNLGVTLGSAKILHDINIHFHCGQMTAIIGPNGAGKSTLMKALIGEVPYTGEIVFQKPEDNNSRKPVIGYVPQKATLDPDNPITVRDIFMSAVSIKPLWLFRDRKIDEAAMHALGHMDAQYLYRKKIGTLSGGELQRVMVALALTPMPALLLLDEPVTGIDHIGMGLFYKMVSNLRREHDLSIVMVSHDLALSAQYADRMVLLKGTVLSDGSSAEVISDPLTKELMGFSLPEATGEVKPTDHHKKEIL